MVTRRANARLFLTLLPFSIPVLYGQRVRAQERDEEIVANLAAGRLVIFVAADGILVGTLENPIEPETRPPVIVPISSRRVAVLLGAVDWFSPATGRAAVRFDQELPRLVSHIRGGGPHLGQTESSTSDIEQTGLAVLGRLRSVAGALHAELNLPESDPLFELLLVGYVENYGPEVWDLQYRIVQEPLRGDYWQTRVLRPSYNQLYPPEKHQPHSLIEIHYPPSSQAPPLSELLATEDPSLTSLRSGDPALARAVDSVEHGKTQKARISEAEVFLRAALAAIGPQSPVETIALIDEQKGFAWILAPPGPPKPALGEERTKESGPPGAPSLRKPPPP
jgi:hypothetical protein